MKIQFVKYRHYSLGMYAGDPYRYGFFDILPMPVYLRMWRGARLSIYFLWWSVGIELTIPTKERKP